MDSEHSALISSSDPNAKTFDTFHENDTFHINDVSIHTVTPKQPTPIKEELKRLVSLAWPVALSLLLINCSSMIIMAFVGQKLGTTELDAVGLGISMNDIFGMSVCLGIGTSMDTLASQAYGAGKKFRVGVIAQRTLIVLGLAMLLCWAVWLNAESLLILLQQDPEVSRLTARYCLLTLPMLPGFMVTIVCQKFLQVQHIVRPLIFIGLFSTLANITFLAIFVTALDMGLDGAAISTNLSNISTAVVSVLYLKFSGKYKVCWNGWEFAAFLEWNTYMKLALPGLAMICLERWTFQICQFLAGVMGPVDLAAQLIVLQICTNTFMIALGISTAANVRVGNLVGAGNPQRAKLSARLSLLLVFITSSICVILFVAGRYVLSRPFTSDPEVIETIAQILIYAGIMQTFDHGQGVFAGILRGLGLQKIGAAINLIGYWFIGMPIGIALAFPVDLTVRGLWIGLVICVASQCFVHALFLGCKVNWEVQSVLARERANTTVEVDGHTHDNEALDHSEKKELLNSKLKGTNAIKSRRQVLLVKGLWSLAVFLVFAAALTVRFTVPTRAVCYPIPEITNATSVCGSVTSILSGDTCSTECGSNFTLVGQLMCGENGTFSEFPSCILNQTMYV